MYVSLWAYILYVYFPLYFYVATSEMWCWSRGRGILRRLSLCYSIVYHYNGAQCYEQFLWVSWLDQALILRGLALYLSSASVSSILMVLHIFNFFWLHSLLRPLISCSCRDWPSTSLTNHCPSVLLWHCWLGHVTHKIVPKMTCNVSSGTLNPTILYCTFMSVNCTA